MSSSVTSGMNGGKGFVPAAAVAASKQYMCMTCGKQYQRNTHLRRHEATRKLPMYKF